MFLVNIFLRFLIWKSSTRALPDSFSTRFSHRLLARPRCSFHVLLIASWCVSTPGCLIRDEEDRERGGGGEPADLWIALKFFLCDTHTHTNARARGRSCGNLSGWPGIWERRGQGHGSLSALHRAAGGDNVASWGLWGPQTWVSQHSRSIPLTLPLTAWRTAPVPERLQK